MGKWEDARHVISGANVRQYIDETNDGGYWYVIRNGEPRFVEITDKALEIFGYDSLEELVASGETPHTLVIPTIYNGEDESAYWDFINLKTDRFNMSCILKSKDGSEKYGQIFIARSMVFPNADEEPIYRVMVTLMDSSETIFKQSKQLLDNMSSGVAIVKCVDEDQYILNYANDGYCRICHCTREFIDSFTGQNIMPYAFEDDRELILTVYSDAKRTGKNIRSTYRIKDFEGDTLWIKAEHKQVKIGEDVYLYIYFMDITCLMNIQMEMQNDNNRLLSFINNTPAGIAIFGKELNGYVIRGINATLISSLNKLNLLQKTEMANERKDFEGINLDEFINLVDEMDKPLIHNMLTEVERNGEAQAQFRLDVEPTDEFENIWVSCRVKFVKKTDGADQLIAVYENISRRIKAENELKKKQEKIMNLSYYDALTGVLNRQSYNELLMNRGHSKFENVGVGFIDLNGLKVLNDLYGHSKGDDALRLTVMLIEHYFEKDEIYRLSGDNFIIIKEQVAQETFYSKMDQLLVEFNKYDIASIGYNWNETVYAIVQAIDKAEEAERVAKQDYYARHREDKSKHRPMELDVLMQDIAAGRYVMYLQPKAYTQDTTVVAAESLIRKIDKDGRVVPPIEFVPLLERQRLVPHLDFFMLEETCRTLERWNKEAKPNIKISVNMSRVTLAEPDYINRILAITDKYDIEHSQIEFEITESQETMDRHKLEEIVIKVSELGFGVSLDDMGTEYSSVMMLAMKGIDTVKIDRGFVLQMVTDEGKTLVEHIIRMCHDLGEICIAEGVEDDDTRELLHNMGCDMYQGYLLAKPIPVVEFEAIIDSQNPTVATA